MKLSTLMAAIATLATLGLFAPIAAAGCNTGSYCNASTRAAYQTLRAATPVNTYAGYSAYGANVATADHPASHYAFASYSDAGNAATGTFSSDQRLSGLADDEYLCPATCPVTVSAPAGARVIDCFQICKKAPTYQTVTQAYKVVRPVIYVRYPVLVPPPAPLCPIIEYEAQSRYGSCGF